MWYLEESRIVKYKFLERMQSHSQNVSLMSLISTKTISSMSENISGKYK